MMKVILLENIEKLGKSGEVVTIREGYGRNFLFPRKLAVLCNDASLGILNSTQKRKEHKEKKLREEVQKLAKRIQELSCTIKVQAGTAGKLFGAVTNQDVQQALKAEGVDIDKRHIELVEPIKKLGVFHIPVKLHADIEAQLKLWIVQK